MSTLLRARTEEVEAWLANGGQVLCSSQRAARSVLAAYHLARRDEGRETWPTPAICAWDDWVRENWSERNRAGLMQLNQLQELAVWSKVIRSSDDLETGQNLRRLARSAQQAYYLLAQYAPTSLAGSARVGWSADAGIFSGWLTAFDSRCKREGLVSSSCLPLLLTSALRKHDDEATEKSTRPPLLLVGFDRLLESQRALLDTWGTWKIASSIENEGRPAKARFVSATDATQETAACVAWLRNELSARPSSRLIVVTTSLRERRGELERALLAHSSRPELAFEFSLGTSLAEVGVVRAALLILSWMHRPLSEPETDWILTSGYCSGEPAEDLALAQMMRAARRRGLERPEWSLEAFLALDSQRPGLPESWKSRMNGAHQLMIQAPQRQSPMDWVELADSLLQQVGWPGYRPSSSLVFQALKSWERLLEDCSSLGFDGIMMSWVEFVSTLNAAATEAIFAAESADVPISITEPLPSAGQLADGIWFLGANADDWPGRGQPHPLLPIGLQREMEMPHASPQGDWRLAQQVTQRLLGSAQEVIFSFARQAGQVEMRPSRLIHQLVAEPEALADLSNSTREPSTEVFLDTSRIRFPHMSVAGGAGVLTRQSLCPFQAFATARLGAEDWEPAEVGLNAKQRGQLLHEVLHRVWGGAERGGLRSLADLQQKYEEGSLPGVVRGIAGAVVREGFGPGSRHSLHTRFSSALLDLEVERLTTLVMEWLNYELKRLPFSVAGTEIERPISVADLDFRLRLDRVDRLADGSLLVIDYKGSEVGPAAWKGKRPDDVQLPLYASFAALESETASEIDNVYAEVQGLVIGQVRAGEMKFAGCMRDAVGTLMPTLGKSSGLVKDPLDDEQLIEWHRLIEQLGEDFRSGKAEVDPKNPEKTCENCCLHAVCRINENRTLTRDDLTDDSEEDDDA